MKHKKVPKREKLLILAVIFLSLGTFGAFLNMSVVGNNDCRMPVYTGKWLLDTNTHFNFTEKESVNQFLLTDIIHIKLFREGYYSIGDILIYLGGLGFIYGWFSYGVMRMKGKK